MIWEAGEKCRVDGDGVVIRVKKILNGISKSNCRHIVGDGGTSSGGLDPRTYCKSSSGDGGRQIHNESNTMKLRMLYCVKSVNRVDVGLRDIQIEADPL